VDRRERLHAVLRGESIDRVLCGFWNHFSSEQWYGKAAVQAHVDYYHKVKPDMLKVMNEHLYRLEKPISHVSDWKGIKALPWESTGYEQYLEEFRMLRRELPQDLPLFATVHGVLVSAYHATEEPGFFGNLDNLITRHLREDPDTVAEALKTVVATLSRLVTELVKAGADGIFYAALGGEAERFEESLFENYVKPLDAAVIEHIKDQGAISVLHICKGGTNIPMYAGIDADVINWALHESSYTLTDGRRLFPGKTLLGGFDDRSGVLVDGTAEEIARKAAKIVSEAGRERFILGADCTLPEDIEIAHLRAVMEAARDL